MDPELTRSPPVARFRRAWRRVGLGLLGGALCALQVAAARDFTHYESAHTHPLALSPAGDRLYGVNTPEARLAIFDVDAEGDLRFASDVPVGLEPVSLALRPGTDEAWVVNHLSDTVSIVDTRARELVATLQVGDEPTDVAFASGRAFVSLSGKDDAVVVYDAQTRDEVRRIPIPGEDPRAMAVSSDGRFVVLVVLQSGNGSTAVHGARVNGRAPPPSPPRNPELGPPPDPLALIVQQNPATGKLEDEAGRDWTDEVKFDLPDRDLFFIDAAAPKPVLLGAIPRIGTTLFDLAIHPVTQEVWVSNTDARNLVRFEPNLRGHLVESRITVFHPLAGWRYVDLNPHVNYGVSPGPAEERSRSLAQPGQGVFDAAGDRFFLTAFGSAKLAVLDGTTGEVLDQVAVGGGPSGVALNEAAARAYVMNRFDHSISTLDLDALREVASIGVAGPRGFDPSPPAVREGRHLLYDATLASGHGDVSCGTCHIFGNFDGLAWDLGDPSGNFLSYEEATWVRFGTRRVVREGFDPMKGPMVTQTLRGLRDMEPFHWRGDRRDFQQFNGAFVSLLGRAEPLPDADMDLFADFIMTVELPPNPYRSIDDSPPAEVLVPGGAGDPVAGKQGFLDDCDRCHRLPLGTTRLVVGSVNRPFDIKVPHLRNIYEKVDLDATRDFDIPVKPGERNRGFFILNDGVVELPALIQTIAGRRPRNDIMAFVLSLPTASFPCIGQQVTLRGGEAAAATDLGRLDALVAQSEAGHCDLVAHGVVEGEPTGWLHDAAAAGFLPDRARGRFRPVGELRASLAPGDVVTWMGVPPENGRRLGIDRDRDGCLDGDEERQGTDSASPATPLPDSDDDGIPDENDLCPGLAQTDRLQTDTNGNGVPDACECGDLTGDGELDARDFAALLRHLLGHTPDGTALEKCNVSGEPGNGPDACTLRDLLVLHRGLLGYRSHAPRFPQQRRGFDADDAPRFRPLCLPQVAPLDPLPQVCLDEPAG